LSLAFHLVALHKLGSYGVPNKKQDFTKGDKATGLDIAKVITRPAAIYKN
jgi:hypothetical protein